MFEKNMKIAYLVDFYGDMLDEHTRAIMEAYYDDDLSLAEIAEGEGISRQGVRHTIKRGEEQLDFLETRLGLAEKHREIEILADKLSELGKKLSDTFGGCAEDFAKEITEISDKLLNKGV